MRSLIERVSGFSCTEHLTCDSGLHCNLYNGGPGVGREEAASGARRLGRAGDREFAGDRGAGDRGDQAEDAKPEPEPRPRRR